MAVSIVVETGEGIAGANAYEAVASALTRLSDLGFTAFADLANDAARAVKLVMGTRSVDTSLHASARGTPKRLSQGLYYPRAGYYTLDRFVDTFGIPDDVILASALKAEFLAARDAASNELASMPAGVLEVVYADGVRIKKAAGQLRSPALVDLQAEISSLVDRLTASPVTMSSTRWSL